MIEQELIEQEQRIKVIKELEHSFEEKEERLPKSISTYIRRLKEAGRFEDAMLVREEAIEKRRKMTRPQRAAEKLNDTVKLLLETDNPQLQSVCEVSAIWLLNVAGVIDDRQRMEELRSTLDSKAPELTVFLDEKLVEIRERALKI